MSDEVVNEEVTQEVSQEVTTDDSLLGTQQEQAPERPEWLLDKYMAEGRSLEEAQAEQAKAYTELQGRFGSFTGAPDEYDLSLSEELVEAGIELDTEDQLLQEFMGFAKESNMSQDGFSKMLNLYSQQEIAKGQALDEYKAEQMKELGAGADARIQNIVDWGSKNLDPEIYQGLQSMATSAEAVKTIESLINLTQGGSVDVDNSQGAGGFTAEDLRSMQFEKDAHGNRKIQTDPDFRKRYNEMAAKIYPGEHRQIVG